MTARVLALVTIGCLAVSLDGRAQELLQPSAPVIGLGQPSTLGPLSAVDVSEGIVIAPLAPVDGIVIDDPGIVAAVLLPGELLWELPLANQREPKLFAKFGSVDGRESVDTAIGTEFGLVRWTRNPLEPRGLQLDIFGAAFTRFADNRTLVGTDYRVGVPITYANGPWQARISYEHTSSHLGDDFIQRTGRMKVGHIRDEAVFGLARTFQEQLRLYGQFGYSFHTSTIIGDDRDRYDVGVEWKYRKLTGWYGRPFAAVDLDVRSDQSYEPNVTVQAGWLWDSVPFGRSLRLSAEYYTGKSPFGQFFRENESWVAGGIFYDW